MSLVFVFTCTFSEVAAKFTEVGAAAGLNHVQWSAFSTHGMDWQPYMTGGAAAGDYDGDGWVDLYFTRTDDSDLLYRNRGDGTFVDVTDSAFGLNHLDQYETNGVAWADIDNDHDLDLYVTSVYSNRYHLYVNNGDGTFAEDALSRGAAIVGEDLHFGYSPTFGDYDNDGFVDLHVTEWRTDDQNTTEAPHNTRLLRNLGAENPGHFVDVTQSAGVATDGQQSPTLGLDSQAFTSRFVDMDLDGHVDLTIASDHFTSRLFWNSGDGTFEESAATGIGTDRNGMGSAIGDVDNDGDFDWFVTSIFDRRLPTRDGNRLYINQGDRTFVDATDTAGVRDGGWGWGAEMLDYDNDGDLDIIETNGMSVDFNPAVESAFGDNPMRLWENDGTGVFEEVAASVGLTDAGRGKGLLSLDYDRDGDLDVVVVNNGEAPVLYRNDTVNENEWLQVNLVGTASNANGVGAVVRIDPDRGVLGDEQVRQIEAGNNFLGQSESHAHFGLGVGVETIDEIVIEWPSGTVQNFADVEANQRLVFSEFTDLVGDYDGNQVVDLADYEVWKSAFGSTTWLDADGNHNGIVDAGDFTAWRDAYSERTVSEQVPEPTGLEWLFIPVVICAIRRLRLRR